jgi:hypothetical protein
MKIKVSTVRTILNRLSESMGHTQDFTGFREMSEKLELGNSHYLYKKVHQKIQSKSDKAEVGLSRFHLNKIAKHFGFTSYQEFEASLKGDISPQLASLIGVHYCYVRANLTQGTVLRSPVRIWKKESKIWWELKGPSIVYQGEVVIRHGCLFILMSSKEGKAFHHIYKIGNRLEPRVLQGVFSGVSTAFDPIGGRTVLIKLDTGFNALTNKKMEVVQMRKSRLLEEKVLSTYFKEYSNNNVAPNKSAGFNLDDLK